MRQVLFRIPLDGNWSLGPLGEVPGFGLGIVLGVWILFGGIFFWRNRKAISLDKYFLIWCGIWLALAIAIYKIPQAVHWGYEAKIAKFEAVLNSAAKDSRAYREAYRLRDEAWRKKRDYRKAIKAYRQEILENPNAVAAHQRLAWIFATATDDEVRDSEAAIRLSLYTNRELTSNRYAPVLDTLATAYASAGEFEKAVEWERKASQKIQNDVADEEAGSLAGIRKRLGYFLEKKPYRDSQSGRSIPVYGYGFMMLVGFSAATWIASRRAKSVGESPDTIWDMMFWLFAFGLTGARLFYVIQKRKMVFRNAESLPDYLFTLVNLQDGGLVFFGGMLGGLLGFYLFCKKRKIDPLLWADICIPSLFIGLAFGRVGCFMNGCCYGGATNLPWKVNFPLGSVPDLSLVERGFVSVSDTVSMSIHPTQIYSSINAFILAGVLHWYFRVRPRNGSVFAAGLIIYPITRFLIEIIRNDEKGIGGTILTISQWVSLGMVVTGIFLTIWLNKKPQVKPAEA